MKKTLRLVFLILSASILTVTFAYATGNTLQFAQISKDVPEELVYLFLKPQDGTDTSFGYNKGTFLMILAEVNGWYHVSIGNQQGYIKTDKIVPADSFTSTASLPVALANPTNPTTGWVNLREAPSQDSAGLVRATKDQEILVIGENDEWAHVIFEGKLGFMMKEFLKMTGLKVAYEAKSIGYSLYEPQTTPPVPGKKPPEAGTTSSTSATNTGYTMQLYSETPNPGGSIKVQYPQFGGNGADALNAIVNRKVQSIVQNYKNYMLQEYALSVDMKAAVTLYNNKMASIVFWGVYNLGSADGIGKPYTDLFALNVDLSIMSEVTFPELFGVEPRLEEAFLTKSTFPTNPITSYDASLFNEMRTYQTREYRSEGAFSPIESVQCFFKPDGVVVSVGAVYATGSDHFEAQISYKDIQKFYLKAENFW